MSIDVEIINQLKFNIEEDKIYKLIKKAVVETLAHLEFEEDVEVAISLVEPNRIKMLNKTYRQKDEVTDVLSFVQYSEEGFICYEDEALFLGDIIICLKRAHEQAESFGHSLAREIAYLTCHSTLHLVGYDHENDVDKKEMRTLEKEIMLKMRLQIKTETAGGNDEI